VARKAAYFRVAKWRRRACRSGVTPVMGARGGRIAHRGRRLISPLCRAPRRHLLFFRDTPSAFSAASLRLRTHRISAHNHRWRHRNRRMVVIVMGVTAVVGWCSWWMVASCTLFPLRGDTLGRNASAVHWCLCYCWALPAGRRVAVEPEGWRVSLSFMRAPEDRYMSARANTVACTSAILFAHRFVILLERVRRAGTGCCSICPFCVVYFHASFVVRCAAVLRFLFGDRLQRLRLLPLVAGEKGLQTIDSWTLPCCAYVVLRVREHCTVKHQNNMVGKVLFLFPLLPCVTFGLAFCTTMTFCSGPLPLRKTLSVAGLFYAGRKRLHGLFWRSLFLRRLRCATPERWAGAQPLDGA